MYLSWVEICRDTHISSNSPICDVKRVMHDITFPRFLKIFCHCREELSTDSRWQDGCCCRHQEASSSPSLPNRVPWARGNGTDFERYRFRNAGFSIGLSGTTETSGDTASTSMPTTTAVTSVSAAGVKGSYA